MNQSIWLLTPEENEMAAFIEEYCQDSTYTIGNVRGNKTVLIFYPGSDMDEVAFWLRFSRADL